MLFFLKYLQSAFEINHSIYVEDEALGTAGVKHKGSEV